MSRIFLGFLVSIVTANSAYALDPKGSPTSQSFNTVPSDESDYLMAVSCYGKTASDEPGQGPYPIYFDVFSNFKIVSEDLEYRTVQALISSQTRSYNNAGGYNGLSQLIQWGAHATFSKSSYNLKSLMYSKVSTIENETHTCGFS
ncbi:MAG: hypothetical protein NTV34_01040, partial [Proteobacteria bacterium]|nr:hypothetical protein [Pseudomonadota bacterium]